MMVAVGDFTWAWGMVGVCLTLGYILILLVYTYGWKRMPTWEPPADYSPSVRCSVIVPARNEAERLLQCLRSLADQKYPLHLFEVIIVDDHSTDDTLNIALRFTEGRQNFHVLSLAEHEASLPPGLRYKKAALTLGIWHARGELILSTDADCETPPKWLLLMSSFFEKTGPAFIAAPVAFHRERSLFERFQSLDMLGMMCSTAAGISLRIKNMSNGANLAYSKAAFEAVDGFQGIDHLASGDDILLMQKIAARFPGKTAFLKNAEATVLSEPMPTIKAFVEQRVRWASKSTAYREWMVTIILGWVFLFCWYLLITPLLAIGYGLPMLGLFAGSLLVKSWADYFYLKMMAKFFRRTDLMKSYLASQFLHIAYIAIVGALANLVRRYDWKGRKLR